jgi:hypothetical protein
MRFSPETMRRMLPILIAIACAVCATGVLGAATGALASTSVRSCGSVEASGGGPRLPRLTVTVQGGSVSCAMAREIIHHFQSLITAHARVSGYACKQVNTAGDERCVRGATVIKGTYRS